MISYRHVDYFSAGMRKTIWNCEPTHRNDGRQESGAQLIQDPLEG